MIVSYREDTRISSVLNKETMVQPIPVCKGQITVAKNNSHPKEAKEEEGGGKERRRHYGTLRRCQYGKQQPVVITVAL